MKGHLVPILVALAALTAPAGWYIAAVLTRPDAPEGLPPAAQAELEALRAEVAQLGARVDGLESRLAEGLPDRNRTFSEGMPPPADLLKDNFAQVVLIADRRSVNRGLTNASPGFLKELLGLPSETLTQECGEMTNPALKEMLVEDDVGPIRVKMLRPAILSLRQVFNNIELTAPELYKRIKSSGSLCVRNIRGVDDAASSHAYGLSVDINIDGELDTLGDGRSQLGLIFLADFFQAEGWYWGAGFGREDSMHFEVSKEKLEQWRRLGQI